MIAPTGGAGQRFLESWEAACGYSAVEAWYRRERGSRAFALGGRTATALGREVEAFATRTVAETPR